MDFQTEIGVFSGSGPSTTRPFRLPPQAGTVKVDHERPNESGIGLGLLTLRDAESGSDCGRTSCGRGRGRIEFLAGSSRLVELVVEVEGPWTATVSIPGLSERGRAIPWTFEDAHRAAKVTHNGRDIFATYCGYCSGFGNGRTAPLPLDGWPDDQSFVLIFDTYDRPDESSVSLVGPTSSLQLDRKVVACTRELKATTDSFRHVEIHSTANWYLFVLAELPDSETDYRRASGEINGLNIADITVRMPADAYDFESVCAEWAVHAGFDVSLTRGGPDRGLDLIGSDFAGQCKFHPSQKIGAPDIRSFFGAATQAGKSTKMFFHYGPGFTQEAVLAAQELQIDLWSLDVSTATFEPIPE